MNLRHFLLLFTTAILGLLCSLTCLATPDGTAAIARLKELKTLNQMAQKESDLRKEFYDRVIFQIDTHFKEGSLHNFLESTFTQMAERQPDSPMYDFLLQAAQLMHQRQEKYENPIELTNRFLQAGGILKPMTAEQFLAAQAYSNGERSESAKGMDREELGDFVDRKEMSQTQFVPVLKNAEIREQSSTPSAPAEGQ
jgi:hypothetical protein